MQAAEALFEGYLPEHTSLTIEVTNSKLLPRYIFRLYYRRGKRTICAMAKGDTLPTERNYLFKFYLRQLVLTPPEVSRQFNRVLFYERRARQDEFLFGGKNSRVVEDYLLPEIKRFEDRFREGL